MLLEHTTEHSNASRGTLYSITSSINTSPNSSGSAASEVGETRTMGSSELANSEHMDKDDQGVSTSASSSRPLRLRTERGYENHDNPDEGDAANAVPKAAQVPVLKWRDRMKHFTWTWFTLSMATGGIANVIHAVPFRFHGLYTIGLVFFFLNLLIYPLLVLGMGMRLRYWPAAFRASFVHPTESLFIPAVMISIGTILITITEYGLVAGKAGAWLVTAMKVCYWCYVGLAVLFTVAIYLMIWSTQTFTVQTMTPVWIFPAYPLLLVGPFASVLTSAPAFLENAPSWEDTANTSNFNHGLTIITAGVVVQGMGFLLSLTMHATYIYRLMTQKLPAESSRPGMFISVGPAGFTATGLIGMAGSLPGVVGATFLGEDGQFAASVSRIMGIWAGVWLWGLTLIFFFIAVGAHWSCLPHKMAFSMTWNAFIFPNTAFTTATFAVGKAFGNRPIQIVGCVLTCGLVIMWLFVVGMGIRAIILRQILWPQKQEDRDEDLQGSTKKRMALEQHRMNSTALFDMEMGRGHHSG